MQLRFCLIYADDVLDRFMAAKQEFLDLVHEQEYSPRTQKQFKAKLVERGIYFNIDTSPKSPMKLVIERQLTLPFQIIMPLVKSQGS